MPPRLRPAPIPTDGALIAKALSRAAERLGVNSKTLARIVGLSEASVSRMKRGDYPLESKPFELGVLFLRLFRSLDALAGGDDDVSRQWLGNDNIALDGKPIELVQSVTGLTNVIAYLDARRALV